MTIFVIVIHMIACAGLIAIILMQRGRGGGFIESFQGLESMFGTKTSEILTKLTQIFAITFFITSVSLTFLNLRESRSLMRSIRPQPGAQAPATVPATNTTAAAAAAVPANTQGPDQKPAAAVPQNQTAP